MTLIHQIQPTRRFYVQSGAQFRFLAMPHFLGVKKLALNIAVEIKYQEKMYFATSFAQNKKRDAAKWDFQEKYFWPRTVVYT